MSGLLEWLQAATAPILAGFGIWIAWRQHRLDRDKARSQRFDLRFAVYETLIDVLRSISSISGLTEDSIIRFDAGTARAVFLFDGDVNEYLAGVRKRLLEAWIIEEQKREEGFPSDGERERLLKIRRDHMTWFRDQILQAHIVFERYMKVGY